MSGLPGIREQGWKLILGSGSGGWSKASLSVPACSFTISNMTSVKRRISRRAYPERVARMQLAFEQIITNGQSTAGEPQRNDVPVLRYAAKDK